MTKKATREDSPARITGPAEPDFSDPIGAYDDEVL